MTLTIEGPSSFNLLLSDSIRSLTVSGDILLAVLFPNVYSCSYLGSLATFTIADGRPRGLTIIA